MSLHEWQTARRILGVRLDNIGDVVMLGPALRTLKENLPDAKITLMASPAGNQVAPLLPWIDDVIVHSASWQDISGKSTPDAAREAALVNEIRRRQFDAAIVFTSFSQSPYPPAYVCYLANIPIRLGQSKEFGGSALSQWVKPLPDPTHQVDRNLHLLESAGFRIGSKALELRIPAEVQEQSDELLRANGIEPDEDLIVLAPGASAQARRYEPARYRRVMHLLAEQTQLPIAVVGCAKEKEIVEDLGWPIVSLIGQTTVPQMAGVIRRAGLVIANDSAPMHIADALRRPMVVLFSGTEYETQWNPRSSPSRLLRRETDCSPCYSFRCPFNMECLEIPPEQVAEHAIRMLEAARGIPMPLLFDGLN